MASDPTRHLISRRTNRLVIRLLVVACATFAVSCGGSSGGNELRNPGLEDGKAGWESLADATWFPSFDLGDIAHGGTHSVLLRMRGAETQESQNTLRSWADSGRIDVHVNPANGYRLFLRKDLEGFLRAIESPYAPAKPR